jgi:hypothetical protein
VPSSPAAAAPKRYLLPQTASCESCELELTGDGGAIYGAGERGATGRPAPWPAGGLVLLLRILRELIEERLERAAAGGLLVPFRHRGDPAVGRGVDGAAGGGVPQRAGALQGQEVTHQRGRPRRAAPPARPVVRVRVVVAQVDASGQGRVVPAEVVSSVAPRRRRHCADPTS